MNKLACIAIILLGLMLLFTHLAVTFIVGAAPSFVVSTCTAVNKIELIKQGTVAFGEEFAKQLAKTLKQPLDQNEINFEDTNQTLFIPEEDSGTQTDNFEQNDILFVTSLKETSVSGCIQDPTFSIRSEGQTVKFPLWVSIYGLVGSVLIISGTTFLAITALKKIKK